MCMHRNGWLPQGADGTTADNPGSQLIFCTACLKVLDHELKASSRLHITKFLVCALLSACMQDATATSILLGATEPFHIIDSRSGNLREKRMPVCVS